MLLLIDYKNEEDIDFPCLFMVDSSLEIVQAKVKASGVYCYIGHLQSRGNSQSKVLVGKTGSKVNALDSKLFNEWIDKGINHIRPAKKEDYVE